MKDVKKMMWLLPLTLLALASCAPQKGAMEEQTGGTDTSDSEEYTEFAAKGITMKGGGEVGVPKGGDSASEMLRPTVIARPVTPYPHSFFIYMPVLYGGAFKDEASGIAVDQTGKVHVVGRSFKDASKFEALWITINNDGNITRNRFPELSIYISFNTEAVDIEIDGEGNIYIMGNGYSSASPTGIFVIKYNSSGAMQWMQTLGIDIGGKYNRGYDIVVDEDHRRVFVVGANTGAYVRRTSDFFGEERETGGYYDTQGYIVMLNPSTGEKVWEKQIGSDKRDEITAAAVDAGGNLYIGGTTFGTLGEVRVPNPPDMFLGKYDASNLDAGTGNIVLKQFVVSGDDALRGLAVDRAGNLYAAGSTEGDWSGTGNKGKSDAVVAKFDGDFNQVWAKQFGAAEIDAAYALTIDNSDNVYIAGIVDKGVGLSGKFAAYKMDTNGNIVWSARNDCKAGKCDAGAEAMSVATAVALDSKNDVYVAGNEFGDFMCRENAGASDIFVLRFNNSGN